MFFAVLKERFDVEAPGQISASVSSQSKVKFPKILQP